MAKPTSPKEWKAKSKVNLQPTPLDLPSGNTALVQPAGMDIFLKQGMIPNSLMPIIQEQLERGQQGKSPEQNDADMLKKLMTQPQLVQDIFALADAVTIACVLDPPILPVPEAEALREEDLLYVDEVDLDDKMFILDFAVGGTRDLEKFRTETDGRMAAVQSSQSVRGNSGGIGWTPPQ